MSEHKLTENITQRGETRIGQIVCSCGVEHEVNLRKTSLRVFRAEFNHMHKQVNERKILPESGGSVLTPDELRTLNKTPKKKAKKEKTEKADSTDVTTNLESEPEWHNDGNTED